MVDRQNYRYIVRNVNALNCSFYIIVPFAIGESFDFKSGSIFDLMERIFRGYDCYESIFVCTIDMLEDYVPYIVNFYRDAFYCFDFNF